MANLSDATVDIVVEEVSKELLDYINITNQGSTDYVIVYDGFDTHINANGDFVISGSSSGRWAYSINLEGYFDDEHVKNWLGVGADYSYITDNEVKQKYLTHASEQYAAYQALIKAIKDRGGHVEINYTDCDPAMDWMSTGSAVLEVVGGEVRFLQSSESEDLNIASYAEIQGETELWALGYLHGDEAAEAYDKYVAKCEEEGSKPSDPQLWYDNEYEMDT